MRNDKNFLIASELSPYKGRRLKWSIACGIVFPNEYSLAMSNLGFQTVFRLLSEDNRILPLRYFSETLQPDGNRETIRLHSPYISLPYEPITDPFCAF
jgi:hypothetical protein